MAAPPPRPAAWKFDGCLEKLMLLPLVNLSYCWWQPEIRRSPVEVGSCIHVYPLKNKVSYHPKWCLPDFWTINNIRPGKVGELDQSGSKNPDLNPISLGYRMKLVIFDFFLVFLLGGINKIPRERIGNLKMCGWKNNPTVRDINSCFAARNFSQKKKKW